MDDRLANILKDELALIERQLALADAGVTFSLQEAEGLEFVAASETELRFRADALRNAISRHDARDAEQSRR